MRVGRIAAIVTAYGAAVLWLTWPLGAHLATHVPATQPVAQIDLWQTAALLGFESRSLAYAPAGLLDVPIYHPVHGTLFYSQPFFGALPLFAPMFLLTGNPALAINVVFLAGLALTAAAVHWVVWRWTGSHAASFVAAAVLLLDRWLVRYWVPVSPVYALLPYLPLIIFHAAKPTPTLRAALVLLVLVVLQCLTDPLYVAASVLVPLGLLAAARLARPATRVAGLRLAAVLVVACALLAPLWMAFVAVRSADPNLSSFWNPTRLPIPLPWGLLHESLPTSVPVAAWTLIALGLVLAWPGRRVPTAPPARAWGHAALWTVLGAVLSLDGIGMPGMPAVRMPQLVVLDYLGVAPFIRMVSRFGTPAAVGLALLSGLAFAAADACLLRSRGRMRTAGRIVAAAAVVVALYADVGSGWSPVRNPPLPEAYPIQKMVGPTIVSEALRMGKGPVLELDSGGGAIELSVHTRAMIRALYHGRPLLNGYSSYAPSGFGERMELAAKLPDAAALAALRRDTGLAHVVVTMRGGETSPSPGYLARARAAGMALVATDGAAVLFEVRPPDAPSDGGRASH